MITGAAAEVLSEDAGQGGRNPVTIPIRHLLLTDRTIVSSRIALLPNPPPAAARWKHSRQTGAVIIRREAITGIWVALPMILKMAGAG